LTQATKQISEIVVPANVHCLLDNKEKERRTTVKEKEQPMTVENKESMIKKQAEEEDI